MLVFVPTQLFADKEGQSGDSVRGSEEASVKEITFGFVHSSVLCQCSPQMF